MTEPDPTIATPEEILTAVERWARVRPDVATNGDGQGCAWRLTVRTDGLVQIEWLARDEERPGLHRYVWADISPATALAWALCLDATETLKSPPLPSRAEAMAWAEPRVGSGKVEIHGPAGVSARRPGEPAEYFAVVTRPLTVDVGRCRVCSTLHTGKWRREVVYDLLDHPDEWRCFAGRPAMQRAANAMAREGLLVVLSDHANRFKLACCRGLLRDTREAARLVLDAAPRPCVTCSSSGWTPASRSSGATECWSCGGNGTAPGGKSAREALAVLADQLQQRGDPFGELLALRLVDAPEFTQTAVDALTAVWERLTVPFGRCEETGRITTYRPPAGFPVMSASELELPGGGLGGPYGAGVSGHSTSCPDCDGHGRVRPKTPTVRPPEYRAEPSPQERERALISRLLTAVQAGEIAVEVDRADVIGRRAVRVSRPRPSRALETLATDEPRIAAIRVEEHTFDIMEVEFNGERRFFAVIEGVSNDEALAAINAIIALGQTVDNVRSGAAGDR